MTVNGLSLRSPIFAVSATTEISAECTPCPFRAGTEANRYFSRATPDLRTSTKNSSSLREPRSHLQRQLSSKWECHPCVPATRGESKEFSSGPTLIFAASPPILSPLPVPAKYLQGQMKSPPRADAHHRQIVPPETPDSDPPSLGSTGLSPRTLLPAWLKRSR